jgi:hypothetical protein
MYLCIYRCTISNATKSVTYHNKKNCPCLIKHPHQENIWGSTRTDPQILNLGTRCPSQSTPMEKVSGTHCRGGWCSTVMKSEAVPTWWHSSQCHPGCSLLLCRCEYGTFTRYSVSKLSAAVREVPKYWHRCHLYSCICCCRLGWCILMSEQGQHSS